MTANLDELSVLDKSVQTNDQFMESSSVKLIKIQKYEQTGLSGKCHVTECLISYSPRRESTSTSNVKKLTQYFEQIIQMNKGFFACKSPQQKLSLHRRRSLPAHERCNLASARKHGHSETCLLGAATEDSKRAKFTTKLIAEKVFGDSLQIKKDAKAVLQETVRIKKISAFNKAAAPPALYREQKKRYTFSPGDYPVSSFAEKIKFFNRTSM